MCSLGRSKKHQDLSWATRALAVAVARRGRGGSVRSVFKEYAVTASLSGHYRTPLAAQQGVRGRAVPDGAAPLQVDSRKDLFVFTIACTVLSISLSCV